MRTNVRIALAPLVLAALSALSANAQTILSNPTLHSLVHQGIDLTWQQRYDEADSVFLQISREFPDHPAGYVYMAGALQSRAIDHEMQIDVARFDSLIELAKRKAKALIDQERDTKWGYFFLGTADGYSSYARVYRGDWIGGAMKGFASVSSFKDAIKLDSALYDSYAGIGAFYYWRSRRTEYFNWLVGDDRPEAFTFLRRTVDKGLYNKHTALSMLVAIYTDAGWYEKAVECSRIGLMQYPANRTFLWGLATALHKLDKFSEAAEAYQKLLEAIVGEPDNNRYNEIVCRLNLAKVSMALGDSTQVRRNLDVILKLHENSFPAHLKSRVQDKLEQAGLLMRKLYTSGSFEK